MKHMDKIIIIIAATLTLSGCAGRIVHMENSQGAKITCKVSTTSAMLTGVIARDSSIRECVNDKKAAGFKVTGEE